MICYILKVKQHKLKYVWAHAVSIWWMLPQATCCYIHYYYLHPFHFVSFKCKDLVAKQHLTNVCYLVLVESTAVYILYITLLHNNVTFVHNYISGRRKHNFVSLLHTFQQCRYEYLC